MFIETVLTGKDVMLLVKYRKLLVSAISRYGHAYCVFSYNVPNAKVDPINLLIEVFTLFKSVDDIAFSTSIKKVPWHGYLRPNPY